MSTSICSIPRISTNVLQWWTSADTPTGRFWPARSSDSPFALTQNLLCALVKLKEGGRCQAFGSFHYDGDVVPDADDLLRQIQWFDQRALTASRCWTASPACAGGRTCGWTPQTTTRCSTTPSGPSSPILYHINDPIEFWYRDRLPQWAVEKNFFYGDGTFPHKFEIDEETFGFLRKHPNLNLCIPHFFFISDQPGAVLRDAGPLSQPVL